MNKDKKSFEDSVKNEIPLILNELENTNQTKRLSNFKDFLKDYFPYLLPEKYKNNERAND